MMTRWRAITGGSVSSDGLRAVTAMDAELAILVSAVLRAMNAVVQTFVKPNPATSTKVANESPPKTAPAKLSKSPTKPAAKPRRVNMLHPPALRFVPAQATTRRPIRSPVACGGPRSLPAHPCHRMPDIEPYAMLPPQPRSRSPPRGRRLPR